MNITDIAAEDIGQLVWPLDESLDASTRRALQAVCEAYMMRRGDDAIGLYFAALYDVLELDRLRRDAGMTTPMIISVPVHRDVAAFGEQLSATLAAGGAPALQAYIKRARGVE